MEKCCFRHHVLATKEEIVYLDADNAWLNLQRVELVTSIFEDKQQKLRNIERGPDRTLTGVGSKWEMSQWNSQSGGYIPMFNFTVTEVNDEDRTGTVELTQIITQCESAMRGWKMTHNLNLTTSVTENDDGTSSIRCSVDRDASGICCHVECWPSLCPPCLPVLLLLSNPLCVYVSFNTSNRKFTEMVLGIKSSLEAPGTQVMTDEAATVKDGYIELESRSKTVAAGGCTAPSFEVPDAKYDVFLTHDWGTDELGRNNHDRVSKVNEALKKQGLVTWFDSDRMQGQILDQMCRGIDNSYCVVVFVTKRYMEKVYGSNENDNCKIEFNYVKETKSAQLMLAVPMEPSCLDPKKWIGAVRAVLGARLYTSQFSFDMDAVDGPDKMESNVAAMIKEILTLKNRCVSHEESLTQSSAAPVMITSSLPTSSSSTTCEECEDGAATVSCADCGMVFCGPCSTSAHAKGKRKEHQLQSISSVAK